MRNLLDLVQQRRALGMIELDRLLLEQRVDVGIVSIGIDAALDDEGFEAGRGVAERGAAGQDQVPVFLSRIAPVKRGRSIGRKSARMPPSRKLLTMASPTLAKAASQ